MDWEPLLAAVIGAVAGGVDRRLQDRAQREVPPSVEGPEILSEFSEACESLVRYVQSGRVSRAEAEDAVAHALLRACEKANREDPGAQIRNPRAWLRVVASNRVRDPRHRRPETPVDRLPDVAAPGLGHGELVVEALDVAAVLQQLPPHLRQVLIGRMYHVSYDEIAESLDIEPRLARNRMRLARHRLRGPLAARVRRPDTASVVEQVASLAGHLSAHGGDLRTMGHEERREIGARTTELRKLLLGCRAGRFDTEESKIVVGKVAVLAETLVADRDERAARDLARAAAPHLRFLRSPSTETFRIRRALAEAWSELGEHQRAEKLLRALSLDEQNHFGAADPRTELLLHWALMSQGQFVEAEAGFAALTSRLGALPDRKQLLLHALCRQAWLLGRLGRTEESVRTYTRVISSRTLALDTYHPDTLDAGHSRGKGLVLDGQGERAFVLLDPLLDVRARVQGDRHPDSLETAKYRHIARVQTEPRDDRAVSEAFGGLEEILDVQTRRHGGRHPASRDTDRWLTWLQDVRGANRSRDPLPPIPSL
ncbi:sigma factor-like helix-turn-helix DNA-binding protein [Actinomadura napierensis]|uniref:RNA polymerase sigma factor 70 region 4 type 2 domain-containing protein n=1 Tax=Actinomadura napierensis TaxID=267854 RepID=A0ABN2ZFP1_9ACTN